MIISNVEGSHFYRTSGSREHPSLRWFQRLEPISKIAFFAVLIPAVPKTLKSEEDALGIPTSSEGTFQAGWGETLRKIIVE